MKHQKIEVPETAMVLFGSELPELIEVNTRINFRQPGERQDETIYVCTGLIGIYKTDNVGHRSIVALRYPNEFILAGGRAPGFGLAAIVPSTVAISTNTVDAPMHCLALARRDEAIAQVWLWRQSFASAIARVAHLLCETAIRSGQGISEMRCPFTQAQIGQITGQTSVNVNRVLAELEHNGLLERRGHAFTFEDWPELCRLAEFKPDYLKVGG